MQIFLSQKVHLCKYFFHEKYTQAIFSLTKVTYADVSHKKPMEMLRAAVHVRHPTTDVTKPP